MTIILGIWIWGWLTYICLALYMIPAPEDEIDRLKVLGVVFLKAVFWPIALPMRGRLYLKQRKLEKLEADFDEVIKLIYD